MTYRWLEKCPERLEAVREMFREYQWELAVDLCFQGWEAELAELPGKYASPSGGILLVEADAEMAACGALRDLGGGVAEIKRLYVRPAYRRQGLARAISELLIDRARAAGYARVRLDTLRRIPGAIELYQSLGFEEIPAYNFNPEDDIVYMELKLT